MTMTETGFVARRATVEDLPQLLPLWRLENLPADDLERRFTEFQVACDSTGQIVAAVGLQISGAQACLHSEAIGAAEFSDLLRELLWKRLQVIIQNHALERMWTTLSATYWRTIGFDKATAEQLETLPPAFQTGTGEWLVITLRAANANAALEREFSQLKALQEQESQRMRERVRWAKRIALGITIVLVVLVLAWLAVILKVGPRIFQGR